jgi:hypothetical protein
MQQGIVAVRVAQRMAVKKANWTVEENERLKAFVAKDVSIIKVAAALKRTLNSVRVQARKLGTPFPHMKDYRKKFKDSPVNTWRLY